MISASFSMASCPPDTLIPASYGYQKPPSLHLADTSAEDAVSSSAAALSNIYAAHSRSMILRDRMSSASAALPAAASAFIRYFPRDSEYTAKSNPATGEMSTVIITAPHTTRSTPFTRPFGHIARATAQSTAAPQRLSTHCLSTSVIPSPPLSWISPTETT